MSDTGIKDKIIEAVNSLPDDTSIEEVMERLYLLYKIEKGIKQADNAKLSAMMTPKSTSQNS